ncbi:YbjQ family protein [archaeon]|nr:YbjQ family protein [archaeon]
MLLINTENIPGKKYEVLGIVQGNTVKARNFFADFGASLKTIIGGEIGVYTKAIRDARKQAVQRMIEEANALGADAIVNIRYQTADIMKGAAEVLVYGTAVKYAQ